MSDEGEPLEQRCATDRAIDPPVWTPDETFLQFLAQLPQRNPVGESAAHCVMTLMRRGTPLGRELYENSLRHFQDRYALYLRVKDQTRQ